MQGRAGRPGPNRENARGVQLRAPAVAEGLLAPRLVAAERRTTSLDGRPEETALPLEPRRDAASAAVEEGLRLWAGGPNKRL